MKIVTGLEPLKPQPPYPVLTIGNFDGVHLGHQALLRTVVERARRQGGTAMVITFDPHPLKVLAPQRAPQQIQTLSQRLESLHAAGVDILWLVPFTLEVSRITAREFAVDILGQKLGVREICVGKHFIFGRDRQGDIGFLRDLGSGLGFSVYEVAELQHHHQFISSTRVRELLRAGRVSLAAKLLGRPAALRGRIVQGAGNGASLGFPTANLAVENELIPSTGVYLTTAIIEGQRHPGLTNIGYRPTIAASVEPETQPVIETHLLGFCGDLYGREMDVELHYRLRDERQFPSVDLLVKQISWDRRRALRYFLKMKQSGYFGMLL